MTITNDLAVLAGGAGGVNTSGFMRNRIINGAMVIDQRNAGSSVAVSGSTRYQIDRWYVRAGLSSATLTSQRSTTAPAGFTNSLLWSVTTGAAVTSTTYPSLGQAIEGYNTADLNWGSASAVPVTLSFWVRSSVTGTYAGSVSNNASTRSYVFTYTVNSANTFEYKTVTIPGDTSGTWATDNTIGIELDFDMGVGSNYCASAANVWNSALYFGLNSSTKISATTGATFYITGVQLEVGTVATPFEREIYSQTLAKCQRYYQQFGNESGTYLVGGANGTSRIRTSLPLNVTMRAAPTITVSGTPSFYYYGTASPTYSSVALTQSSTKTFTIDLNTSGGLTAGQVSDIVFTSGSAQVAISAEL